MSSAAGVDVEPQEGAQEPAEGSETHDQADELLADNPQLSEAEDGDDGDDDDGDEGEGGEGGDVDEPTQDLGPNTAAELERRGKMLDRLGTYVTKKLTEIFGEEEADSLEPCPLCSWTHTYGYCVPGVPPDFVREAVKEAIGFGTVDELQPYAAFQECATCKGLGNVRTGSQVQGHLYRQCPSCKGLGYSSSLPTDQQPQTAAAPPLAVVGPSISAVEVMPGAPPQEPDFDVYGTPRSHPDYGKMPTMRVLPISHWRENLPPDGE